MERRSQPHSKQQYLLFMLSTMAFCLFGIAMLFANEIKEAEKIFERDTDVISIEIRQKLVANDAVLSGFSALLQGVEASDQNAAARYAEAALEPYPHIYMLEVARQLPVGEQLQLISRFRKIHQPNFDIRDFADLAGRPKIATTPSDHVWPIVFIYPETPAVQDIYGLRLETVPFLSETIKLAPRRAPAAASPVFGLKEGGNAYILLRTVERSQGKPADYFGDTMVTMLLTRTESLMPEKLPGIPIGFKAELISNANQAPSLLLLHEEDAAIWFDHLLLPMLKHTIETGTVSQPLRISFARQLRWANIFSEHALLAAGTLLSIGILLANGLRRHRRAVRDAVDEFERAEFLAMHDALTNLPNRYLLTDRVSQAISRWQRHGAMFALVLVDLDYFKEINDRYGHEVGDLVLTTVSSRISDVVRSCDTVARYGGDEFVILISDVLDGMDLMMLGEKLCRAIGEPIGLGRQTLQVTCSLGIALCPDDGEDFNSLRQQADIAMYRVKKSGRNGSQLAAFRTGVGALVNRRENRSE